MVEMVVFHLEETICAFYEYYHLNTVFKCINYLQGRFDD